jgi:hypothetical protein
MWWSLVRTFLFGEEAWQAVQSRWIRCCCPPARGVDGRWTVDAWAPLEGRVINGGRRWRFSAARPAATNFEVRSSNFEVRSSAR